MKNHTPKALYVSDCGTDTATCKGTDTELRIQGLYDALGFDVHTHRVDSPLGIAFCAATVAEVRQRVGKVDRQVIAVNCASRAGFGGKAHAEGEPLLWLKCENGTEYVGYGQEVFAWLKEFSGSIAEVLEITADQAHEIENCRRGTQFRSLEFLVPVHTELLQDPGGENLSTVEAEEVPEIDLPENTGVVLPSDEFGNGRILVPRTTFEDWKSAGSTCLPELLKGGWSRGKQSIAVSESLTEASNGHLCIWQSSNRLENSDWVVANIGYRWKESERGGNSRRIKRLNKKLSTGKRFSLN